MGRKRREGRQRHAARSAGPAAAAASATPLREPLAWALAALAVAFAVLAWLTSGPDTWWVLAVVDGQSLFAIDDAWRYWLANTAWQQPGIWAWNYMLPGHVLVDGLLGLVTGGNLYAMRALHGLAGCAALWFTWGAGRALGIARLPMTVSVLMLAAMPVFVFVVLSFYGETWLTLTLAGGLYAWARGRERDATLLYALLPLIRPEGIFFLAPLGLHWLVNRRFGLLALLVAPGMAYGAWLLLALPDIGTYTAWRFELGTILAHVQSIGLRRPFGFLETFNALWFIPAFAGLFAPSLRRHWPVWSGALLWLAFNTATIAGSKSFHEARYLLSLLPVLALGWPALFAWIGTSARAAHAPRLVLAAFLAASALVCLEHLRQLDPVKAAHGNARWPFAGLPASRNFYGSLSGEALARRRAAAGAIARIVAGNPAIDRVFVANTELFYFLDRSLARRVQVRYVPVNDTVSRRLLDGRFYAMYPQGRQYGYYRFRTPDGDARKLALFAGRLDRAGFAPLYRDGFYEMYLVIPEASLADGSRHPDD